MKFAFAGELQQAAWREDTMAKGLEKQNAGTCRTYSSPHTHTHTHTQGQLHYQYDEALAHSYRSSKPGQTVCSDRRRPF
jgi:hypothetical protein